MRILNFHSIKEESRARYVTASRDFENLLDACERRDEPIVSLSDLNGQEDFSRPSTMLTFDDGYRDNFSTLLPILEARRLPVVIFLVVGQIGGKNTWDIDGELAGEPLLDWEQIEEMSAAGVLFGSHGMTHVDLRSTDETGLEYEVNESRLVLEDRLGKPVEAFAYPFGRLNERVLSAVEKGGYRFGMTVGSRRMKTRKPHPLALPRIEIRADEPPWKTQVRLRGLRKPKHLYRTATALIENAIARWSESRIARR